MGFYEILGQFSKKSDARGLFEVYFNNFRHNETFEVLTIFDENWFNGTLLISLWIKTLV